MTYTSQKPTEPGWYWLKRDNDPTVPPECHGRFEAVVRVERVNYTIPEKGTCLVCTFMTSPFGVDWVRDDQWQPDCQWAGPIQPPTE